MTTLYDTQQAFSRALRYQASGNECGIAADYFSADERLQIYRNNFIISLTEVLQACYPLSLALVGEECFASMAKFHITRHPPTSGSTLDYGEGFNESVSLLDNITSAVPYLLDVIELEWAIDQANSLEPTSDIDDVEPIVRLANIPEMQHGNIRLHISQDIQVITSDYALLDLKHAIEHEQYESLTIELPQTILLQGNTSKPTLLSKIEPSLGALIAQLQALLPLKSIQPELLTLLPTLLSMNVVSGFSLIDSKDHDLKE
ncbi:hypothetical protein BCU70_15380 [Vibrio sp. 10N.286.49.C2]|uniref:HvfC/BufC N-terminal domain-containing protein n=1 Tax=unclassified Vibrio TaxID=2614977 RepID=UPI000C854F60|nr:MULTISPECIES: DNA-binding domain-containing protein [unclassified Vibrio]PMH37454.1 hypothetical protein BCU70_15380 [Vibrio sp. 10N.286.49.C2]PMH52522.1 hypothetical protein BCU66_15595 [Vibrio sp. 10N.286.49.B1]PMH83507.1 hypothetical protein BCU58_14530 [Vibrio sp. 10N.286.48.B7]